jgi:hypothetical protein
MKASQSLIGLDRGTRGLEQQQCSLEDLRRKGAQLGDEALGSGLRTVVLGSAGRGLRHVTGSRRRLKRVVGKGFGKEARQRASRDRVGDGFPTHIHVY